MGNFVSTVVYASAKDDHIEIKEVEEVILDAYRSFDAEGYDVVSCIPVERPFSNLTNMQYQHLGIKATTGAGVLRGAILVAKKRPCKPDDYQEPGKSFVNYMLGTTLDLRTTLDELGYVWTSTKDVHDNLFRYECVTRCKSCQRWVQEMDAEDGYCFYCDRERYLRKRSEEDEE